MVQLRSGRAALRRALHKGLHKGAQPGRSACRTNSCACNTSFVADSEDAVSASRSRVQSCSWLQLVAHGAWQIPRAIPTLPTLKDAPRLPSRSRTGRPPRTYLKVEQSRAALSLDAHAQRLTRLCLSRPLQPAAPRRPGRSSAAAGCAVHTSPAAGQGQCRHGRRAAAAADDVCWPPQHSAGHADASGSDLRLSAVQSRPASLLPHVAVP